MVTRPHDAPHLGDDAPEVWRDNSGVICARGAVVGGVGWMELPGIAIFRFDGESRAVIAFADTEVADEILTDCYYRVALPMALQLFGLEVLHASAVLTESGVVAFCAISETGKSTAVAALTRRGYSLWADDAVAFEAGDHQCSRALFVPCRMRLDASATEFLGYENTPFRWQNSGPFEAAPLAAICVLQRKAECEDFAQIRRLGRAEAFAELIPHAYCFTMADIERKRRMMEHYFDLVAQTPIYRIAFTPGFGRLASVLNRIERDIPAFA